MSFKKNLKTYFLNKHTELEFRDEPDPIFSGPGRTGLWRLQPDRTPEVRSGAGPKFRTYFTKMSQNQWKFLYGNKG